MSWRRHSQSPPRSRGHREDGQESGAEDGDRNERVRDEACRDYRRGAAREVEVRSVSRERHAESDANPRRVVGVDDDVRRDRGARVGVRRLREADGDVHRSARGLVDVEALRQVPSGDAGGIRSDVGRPHAALRVDAHVLGLKRLVALEGPVC